MKTNFTTYEAAQVEAEKLRTIMGSGWAVVLSNNVEWTYEVCKGVIRVGPSSGAEPFYVAEAALPDVFLQTDAGGIGLQYFAWDASPEEAARKVTEKAIKGTSENEVKLEKFKLGLLGFPLKKD